MPCKWQYHCDKQLSKKRRLGASKIFPGSAMQFFVVQRQRRSTPSFGRCVQLCWGWGSQKWWENAKWTKTAPGLTARVWKLHDLAPAVVESACILTSAAITWFGDQGADAGFQPQTSKLRNLTLWQAILPPDTLWIFSWKLFDLKEKKWHQGDHAFWPPSPTNVRPSLYRLVTPLHSAPGHIPTLQVIVFSITHTVKC